MNLDPAEHLPHGPGFRFVHEAELIEPGVSARGALTIAGDEWYLDDHFPGAPMVPGVLVIEAMAQLAGIAAMGASGAPARRAAIARTDVRFGASAVPPCRIDLEADLERALDRLLMCRVRASVAAREVASGRIVLAIHDGATG